MFIIFESEIVLMILNLENRRASNYVFIVARLICSRENLQ